MSEVRLPDLLDPWEEQAPAVPARELAPVDRSIDALQQRVADLANELDRASRILAARIKSAGSARASYQLEHDRVLLRVQADGRRTAIDQRRALVHDELDDHLYLGAELGQALVDSARAWVRGLELQLSAAQSQLKTETALLGVDDAARATAHDRRHLRSAA